MISARRLVLTALAAAVTLGVAACGSSGGEQQQAAPARTLTISAAASLTDVYNQLKPQFEQAHPGTTVRFNFGGSDTLAQQVVQGVPTDVLATASPKTMQTAQQAGRIEGQPVTYAANSLQIAVAPGNPKQIANLQSLVGPQVTEAICQPTVPCGQATQAAERAAGVTLDPVSQDPDVRTVLQRVTTRNVDAGIVYVTDVKATNGQVQGVDFPQASAQGAGQTYPIGVVAGSQNADLGQQWIQFITGPQGDAALTQAGFQLK
ncbi:molybdate-binding protein [Actinomycetospora sp. NBRC 106375]|uniref:molybdate ABC transporter substrate-binding protein n=1 Tax=Actinomycetospora sp. NBRC 106375 TaxID=3032207 RepID=UPI0024A2B058|nr:molybdate ABC transporter substrate-binding protein [Actinomycetospora sp. NBRC 106375]GLZ45595.1 molybdate-binding protein [Actinomycetospora sp. NBRC 106375]